MPLEERPCEGAEGLGGEAAAARVEVARAVAHIQPARAPLALEARGVELPPSQLRVTHLVRGQGPGPGQGPGQGPG